MNFLRAKYERLTGEVLVRSYPFYMLIDPSSICGLRCPGCGTGLDNAAKRSDLARRPLRKKALMSVDLFDALIEEMGEYLFRVFFYNWGEPLLNNNLPYFIKRAKELDIYTDINTNLSLKLSDEAVEELLLSGIDEIAASIDGFSQETYGIYRVGGSYELAKNNLERLVAFRDKLGLDTRIVWNFLVFSFNEHEIETVRRYCEELGVVFVRKEGYINIVKHPEWLPSYRKRELNGTDGDARPAGETEQAVGAASAGNTCAWHYCYSGVNPDGSVSPCCAAYEQLHDFGKVEPGSTSFADVWNNSFFRKARGTLASREVRGLSNIKPVCEKCSWQAVKDQFTGYDQQVQARFWDLFSGSEPIFEKAFSLLDSGAEFIEFYRTNHVEFDEPDGVTNELREHLQGVSCLRQERRRTLTAVSELVELGERLFGQGRHDEALELFTLVTEIDAGNYANWTDLGVVLTSLGRFDEAGKCLETALLLRPGFAPALENLDRLKNAVHDIVS
jgi:MoaA/NifB/PqqE/SkfB family radical SAM enzyme